MVIRVPFGPINNIQQTFSHPQVIARDVIVEVQVWITVRFHYIFSILCLASARWEDQIGRPRSYVQWEEDASEPTPAMAISAYR